MPDPKFLPSQGGGHLETRPGSPGESPVPVKPAEASRLAPSSDRYEIIAPAGEGGMGLVWKAMDQRLKRLVAIKRIRSELAGSPELLARFRREAQAVAGLRHPNIVQMHDLDEDADGLFQVMDWIEGRNLQQLLNADGPLSVERAVSIIARCADALAAAHDAGLIHRDVKPANILIDRHDVPFVTDFGLVRIEAESLQSSLGTVTGAVLGTIDFIAPEQLADPRQASPASDQWSLGATLYQAVTGRSVRGMRESRIPKELREFVLTALEEEPDERFDSLREFARRLRETVGSTSTVTAGSATGTARPAEAVRPVSRPDAGTPGTPTEQRLQLPKPPLLTAPFTAEEAAARRAAWAAYLQQPQELTLNLPEGNGMSFVLIPPGTFQMGSPYTLEELLKRLSHPNWTAHKDSREWFSWEVPQHRVRITRPMYVGKFAVTRGQFRQFVDETGYRTTAESSGQGGKVLDPTAGWKLDAGSSWRSPGFEQTNAHPVVQVSWDDAQAFVKWLSESTGRSIRLLTEAEWEYCCRAGTTGLFYNGDDLESVAAIGNTADASFKGVYAQYAAINADDGYVFTAPVGQFQPNGFGLYDMLGNVWEWCADWFDGGCYSSSPEADPPGPSAGSSRVVRGGSFNRAPRFVRCSLRLSYAPTYRSFSIGFRIVVES